MDSFVCGNKPRCSRKLSAVLNRLSMKSATTPGISRCGGGARAASGLPLGLYRTVAVQLTWIKAVTVCDAVVVICQLEPHNLVHIAGHYTASNANNYCL